MVEVRGIPRDRVTAHAQASNLVRHTILLDFSQRIFANESILSQVNLPSLTTFEWVDFDINVLSIAQQSCFNATMMAWCNHLQVVFLSSLKHRIPHLLRVSG